MHDAAVALQRHPFGACGRKRHVHGTPNAQVIVLTTPIFLALIVREFTVGRRRGHDPCRLADLLNHISLAVMSQFAFVFANAPLWGG